MFKYQVISFRTESWKEKGITKWNKNLKILDLLCPESAEHSYSINVLGEAVLRRELYLKIKKQKELLKKKASDEKDFFDPPTKLDPVVVVLKREATEGQNVDVREIDLLT